MLLRTATQLSPHASRTFEQQVSELHIRAAILNRVTEQGCLQTVSYVRDRGNLVWADICNNAADMQYCTLLEVQS